jgi:hypothetical protein
MKNWKTDLQNEFQMARRARERGNEGQARVCARRAAGLALREYYQRRGWSVRNPSAYELLKEFAGMEAIPAPLRQAAESLTLRVTEEFTLPATVDLVQEAQTLCYGLLPGELGEL